MREKGFKTLDDFRGLSVNRVTEWKHLNLNFKIVARIDEQKCIGCDLCHIACWDGAHQCIHLDRVSGPVDGHVDLHRRRRRRRPRAAPRLRRRRLRARSAKRLLRRGRIPRRWRAFRAWMRRSAWAAICVPAFARWRDASPWCVSIRMWRRRPGTSAPRARHAPRQRAETSAGLQTGCRASVHAATFEGKLKRSHSSRQETRKMPS